jgi:hypothetical protein
MNTQKETQIKTIDLQAKEWFDKLNGNSYFSAIITLNFGLDNEKTINVPFQYGYGSQHEYVALHQLQCENLAPLKYSNLFTFCNDNNIELRRSKKENCTKKEVKDLVKY